MMKTRNFIELELANVEDIQRNIDALNEVIPLVSVSSAIALQDTKSILIGIAKKLNIGVYP